MTFLGYLFSIILIVMLGLAFVWYPYKVSSYKPATPTHLKQKKEYLKSVKDAAANATIKPNIVIILFEPLV